MKKIFLASVMCLFGFSAYAKGLPTHDQTFYSKNVGTCHFEIVGDNDPIIDGKCLVTVIQNGKYITWVAQQLPLVKNPSCRSDLIDITKYYATETYTADIILDCGHTVTTIDAKEFPDDNAWVHKFGGAGEHAYDFFLSLEFDPTKGNYILMK